MADIKTKKTEASVEEFLAGVDEDRRADCQTLINMMKKATGKQPKMWGPSIIGFDEYHYKYATGREGVMCLTGFSPRKQNLTLYIMPGFTKHKALLAKLGKHTTGKSCLYIKRLADVDLRVLEELITESVRFMESKPTHGHPA